MTAARPVEISHRAVLAVAVPMTLAHSTTPLLGFVDLAVVGQLGDAAALGGVALGAVLFDFIFWPFGFLRMGTAGLTAQAVGADNATEQRATLLRALMLAVGLGALLLLLKAPIAGLGLWLGGGTPEVQAATRTYIDIRLLAAPFSFINYVALGWLIGMGRTGVGLGLQVLINAVNIVCSVTLTLGLGWGIAGVAWGSVIAEGIGAVVGIALCFRFAGGIMEPRAVVFDRGKILAMLAMNRDIMIRSFALLGAFLFFARQGAAQGDVIVAANGVLMNLFLVGAYVLDGFATAVEQLGGRAIGARNATAFHRAARITLIWSFGYAVVLSAALWAGGGYAMDLMTTSPEIREAARAFLPWVALTPIAGALAFHQDGLYIGAAWTRTMRDMMLLSFAIFLVAWVILSGPFGNHGLWAAFLVFLAARGLTLAVAYRRCAAREFAIEF